MRHLGHKDAPTLIFQVNSISAFNSVHILISTNVLPLRGQIFNNALVIDLTRIMVYFDSEMYKGTE